ncbi:hypothetical protein F511_37814 [Dorcoceras hygrometricum]|uniref:Uncharacterized protein n=1 Tax=Dorcoceras hygrometricum TaxID=472368 RepID=A0A2Z7AWH9_9LAMI|nr:hypothetical protein F511_37814 [Dorcoceras hygrometricum]
MEGRKPSSSSFTSDLFGVNDSSSAAASSSAIFGAIFTPLLRLHSCTKYPKSSSFKILKLGIGNESLNAAEAEKKHDSGCQALSAKNGVSGSFQEKEPSSGQGRSQSTANKEMNPYS